jgi:hypothetical protein
MLVVKARWIKVTTRLLKRLIGSHSDRNRRHKRLYCTPKPPLDRLLAIQVLTPKQAAEPLAYLTSFPNALPNIRKDLQVRAS